MSLLLETPSGNYILTKEIGSGGSCICYQGYDSTDISKKKFAFKLFEEKNKKYFDKELSISQHLNTKDFLQTYKHGIAFLSNLSENISKNEKKKVYFLIQEFAENGELFDYIYLLKRPFSEKISSKILFKIANSIKYLHSQNIAHCDIKPENILITSNFELKLIDFGYSHKFPENSKNNKIYIFQGTDTYCSPESIKPSLGYDPFKHDVFSFGVVAFVLTMGKFPFNNPNFCDMHYRYIIGKDYKKFWSDFEKCRISEEFKDFINKLICYNCDDRMSFEQIVEHPWMKKYQNNEKEGNKIIVDELKMRKKEIIFKK